MPDAALLAIAIAGAAIAAAAGAFGLAMLQAMRRTTRLARQLAAGKPAGRVAEAGRAPGGEAARALAALAATFQSAVASAALERERLVAALNSAADAVIAVDLDGRIAFASAAAQRLFEQQPAQLVGQPLAWVMTDEAIVEALRASGKDRETRTMVIERPGRRFLQVVTAPIVGGGDWAALVICHDITDVKRSEQVRRDFVANVSHELRTPLASIKSVIETLEGGALDDPQAARAFLARADLEVDRLVRMVEELLELSRIESGAFTLARQPVALPAVLQSVHDRLHSHAEAKGVRFELRAPPDLPPVIGDAERLEQAVINLVRNAIEFTPAEGSVTLSAAAANGLIAIEVRDTGVGIAASDLPRVFERFYKANRARGGGTGLGLAIVKHSVEAHGGSVSAESLEGEGATFRISLPVAPADG
jgi:two-component system phosphate regulon sensor histidine kinase PhoR